jgi:diketogulonate reductase-like aldo/keto reductase
VAVCAGVNLFCKDLVQGLRVRWPFRPKATSDVLKQVVYNLSERHIEEDLLPYCQQHRVTVMAYSPLARGGLTSGMPLRRKKAMEALARIAQETGKTQAQVALNWCLSRPGVITIPKSDRQERVAENCGASGWRLSAEQVRALDAAFS